MLFKVHLNTQWTMNLLTQQGPMMPEALSASHVYSTPLALHNLLQNFFQRSSCAHCALHGQEHWTWTFLYISALSVNKGSLPVLE